MGSEPPKHPDVLFEIRKRARKGQILFSRHGGDQRRLRRADYSDIKHVLVNGQREEDRDRYNDRHRMWSYAMKGKTLDEQWLRVVVVLDNPNLLVVTVYYMDEEE